MDSGWWAVAVAAVAAFVAMWQAWEARRARRDAQAARDEAGLHERAALDAARESAGAAERSASAHERLAAVAEAQVMAPVTWFAQPVGGETWELVNNTGQIVSAEAYPGKSKAGLTMIDAGLREVEPGGVLRFQWGDRQSTSSFAEVVVFWFTGDSSGVTTTVTLRR